MTDIIYESSFKQEIQGFIQLKRSIGYTYNTEPGILKRFDRYLAGNYPGTRELTREMVLGWGKKTAHETPANHCSRTSIIRQFAKYLDSIGITAWILPNHYYPTGKQYVPYIYTVDELQKFFNEVDRCHVSSEVPFRHLVLPEYFRLLLACGLRCSEARLLKCKDVDLDCGVITVLESKHHNSRQLPLSEFETKRLQKYSQIVHLQSNPDDWFFPGYRGMPMTVGNVYHNFRRFLYKAGIGHTGDGPRVHDFRHTFCCYRLKQWAKEGRDLMALLPLLRTYLGHQTFNETAYYLRWTADVFPEIRIKLEQYCGSLIPTSDEVSNEAN